MLHKNVVTLKGAVVLVSINHASFHSEKNSVTSEISCSCCQYNRKKTIMSDKWLRSMLWSLLCRHLMKLTVVADLVTAIKTEHAWAVRDIPSRSGLLVGLCFPSVKGLTSALWQQSSTEFAARCLLHSWYICFTSGYTRSQVYYLQDNEQ